MSEFDDAIGDMTDDLLTEAGGAFVYRRGAESTAITLRMSKPPAYAVDNGAGQIVEVQPVDFIAVTLSLPYTTPLRGDRITGGGVTYEVQPPAGSDVVYFRKSPQMTRIHAKQIGG